MKSDRFIARVARRAVASTVAGACLAPQGYSADVGAPTIGISAAVLNETSIPEEVSYEEEPGVTMIFEVSQELPEEWTKALGKEFRQLAAAEARGLLSVEQAV